MSRVFERNLALLSRQDPSLAEKLRRAALPPGAVVQPARSGDPTLIYQGITLHSRVDPAGEGEALAHSAAVQEAQAQGLKPAVFGLGLGYHVRALARRFEEVVVLEPSLGLIALALRHLDFTPVLTRLRFVLGRDFPQSPEQYVLVPHPPSVRLAPAEYESWAGRLGVQTGREGRKERGADLQAAGLALEGGPEVLAGWVGSQDLDAAGLARVVESRVGPLSEAEVLILLLQELARRG